MAQEFSRAKFEATRFLMECVAVLGPSGPHYSSVSFTFHEYSARSLSEVTETTSLFSPGPNLYVSFQIGKRE